MTRCAKLLRSAVYVDKTASSPLVLHRFHLPFLFSISSPQDEAHTRYEYPSLPYREMLGNAA